MPVLQPLNHVCLALPSKECGSCIRELGVAAKILVFTVILTLVLLSIGQRSSPFLAQKCSARTWDVSAHMIKSVLSSKTKVLDCISV